MDDLITFPTRSGSAQLNIYIYGSNNMAKIPRRYINDNRMAVAPSTTSTKVLTWLKSRLAKTIQTKVVEHWVLFIEKFYWNYLRSYAIFGITTTRNYHYLTKQVNNWV